MFGHFYDLDNVFRHGYEMVYQPIRVSLCDVGVL